MARILLGDDSKSVTDTLKDQLEIFEGHQVETYATGEDLVARATQGDYAGIITDFDYNTNGLNGLDVIAAIREFDQTNPIYLFTGEVDAERKYGSTPGLTAVISKSDGFDQVSKLFEDS